MPVDGYATVALYPPLLCRALQNVAHDTGCRLNNHSVLLCLLGPLLRGCCLQGVQPLHDLLLLMQQLLH
jgi:hypothetical protein